MAEEQTELKSLNPQSKPDPIDDPKDTCPLLCHVSLSSSGAATATCPPPLPSLPDPEKKFAAYVCGDVYGTLGRGPLQLSEYVLLGFSLLTLIPICVVLALTIIVIYYIICRICMVFLAPNQDGGECQEDYAHMGD